MLFSVGHAVLTKEMCIFPLLAFFDKNVCTHSYSLVWYDWPDWEQFIDWLALSGINNVLALTGQEEVQYQVFRELGLRDKDIRHWFNGPALLTWSRGQNEYGNNICGPLPRSWMKAQYDLQRNHILPRLRSLGIVGQLPGFQGNVPIQLRDIYKDVNITQQGATGWMDALDPLYAKIADLWMTKLIAAFGTDHWYQLDGYFNGGTAPWLENKDAATNEGNEHTVGLLMEDYDNLPHDDSWFQRGSAAFQGLQRTDPDAIWSFQGFAFISWPDTIESAKALKGFVDAAPPGHFVVIDMSYQGMGQWQQFQNASFFGAPFIWTALHDFGGNDGIKGDMRRLNQIPFGLIGDTSIAGVGGTPEGIDQNPAFYDFLFASNFRIAPVQDLSIYMGQYKLRQYGVDEAIYPSVANHIKSSWSLLMQSLYSTERSVRDTSGIARLNPSDSLFHNNRYTPQPMLCRVFRAWRHLLMATEEISSRNHHFFRENNEPFQYDLINLGREILAQLSTPAAKNFTDATTRTPLSRDEVTTSGSFYMELLNDTDALLSTEYAFLLGPWIESARRWGDSQVDDCYSVELDSPDCRYFYEWNARTQITTWNPTSIKNHEIPAGPVDYAKKQWAGLVRDYYTTRARILLRQALKDQEINQTLDQAEVDRLFARHAYEWTTATDKYSTTTTGDAISTSTLMFTKYKAWFSTCQEPTASITA